MNNADIRTPFLTVGIASYNYGRYLPKAFNQIRKQKFKDFEILYCDDGSTDNSLDIIKGFIRDYPDMNIRLVVGQNGGVSVNKNRIIDNSLGKYIMFCDADDWMEDDCLETLCNEAIRTNADQVSAGYQTTTDDGKIIEKHEFPTSPSKWANILFHSTIYKKEIIDKYNIRLIPNCPPDDVIFNYYFHNVCHKVVFVNRIEYNWRQHSDSTSSSSAPTSITRSKVSFSNMLKTASLIYSQNSGEDAIEIEYVAVKQYYGYILNKNINMKFRDLLKDYHNMNDMMKKTFNNYYNNPVACDINGKNIVRKKAGRSIFILSRLEKFHLFPAALWCYWALSHVHRLQVN